MGCTAQRAAVGVRADFPPPPLGPLLSRSIRPACISEVLSELLVYDRNRGASGQIIRQHFAQLVIKTHPCVSRGDMQRILPNSEAYKNLEPGTEETGIARFEMPEVID